MPLAVQIARNGGPEEMKLVEVAVGEPGPGQIRIRHKAIGLNFIDVYQRSGLYSLPLPLQLGMEAAGAGERREAPKKKTRCGSLYSTPPTARAAKTC